MAKTINVEELVNSLIFAEMTAQVFAALKESSETLQQINAQIYEIDLTSPFAYKFRWCHFRISMKYQINGWHCINYQEEISKLLDNNLRADDDLAAEKELERIEMEEIAKLILPSVNSRKTD